MTLLLGCQGIAKAYGAAPLFADVSFGIHESDRIGLVGPNGSGKSTLLRVLAGLETPDAGTIALRRLARLAYVPQHPDFPSDRTLAEVLAHALQGDPLDQPLDEAARHTRVQMTLGRAGFADPDATPATLSGGWRKRLAIARALVRAPDLLLLDEQTNHLDLDGILWLEQLLRDEAAAFLVVSHDRWFLEHVAGRMLDLDPVHAGGFFQTRGRYSEFLERKDAALREQARWQETLASRVRSEIDWLRHGPKARTTKSQARIREAGRLIEELAGVDARQERRAATIEFSATERRTKRLVVVEHAAKQLGERRVLDDVSLVLSPGTRLGVLGANGSGKSTLIRLITGELAPDRGRIERATGLRIAALDQDRSRLDPSVTLRRALAPQGDQVVFGERPIHVAGWARRFLFAPEQLSLPVGRLSGGEQARVLVATLMLQPADVLVLDEPTNDLGGAAGMGRHRSGDRRRRGDAGALPRGRTRSGGRHPCRRAGRALPGAPGRSRGGRQALCPLGGAGREAGVAREPRWSRSAAVVANGQCCPNRRPPASVPSRTYSDLTGSEACSGWTCCPNRRVPESATVVARGGLAGSACCPNRRPPESATVVARGGLADSPRGTATRALRRFSAGSQPSTPCGAWTR